MIWEQLECDTEVLPFLEGVPEAVPVEKKKEEELSAEELELMYSISALYTEDEE